MRMFEIEIKTSPSDIRLVKLNASDVVSALDQLHKQLQRNERMLPDGYILTSINHVYNASVSGTDIVRSPYPVPGGKNPDVRTPS